MWNKKGKKPARAKKLAGEIFEYLVLSVIVAVFTFSFLYLTSQSIVEVYLDRRQIIPEGIVYAAIGVWLRGVCIAAAVIVFVILFLLLLGRRLSYLIQIINGVESMQKRKDVQIPLEGDDELTRLAESINYLTATRKEISRREQEMKDAREAFIRSLSHDIRTPLTSVLSYTELLEKRETVTKEEMHSYMELVRSKAIQVKELMDQLLDGRSGTWEKVEDIRFLAEQLAAGWEELLEERFTCRTDLSGCGSFPGRADISALRRIVDNLISNVEKYADPDREVVLVIESRGNELRILQENGIRRTEGQVESRQIGLESIKETAAAYGGEVQAGPEGNVFRIRITLNIPALL